MYDNENLGSSATEDSSIVTFDSLFVSKEQRISNTTCKRAYCSLRNEMGRNEMEMEICSLRNGNL